MLQGADILTRSHSAVCPVTLSGLRDSLRPVPTPESSEALTKLVAARERLAGLTRQLTEANASIYMSIKARGRYEELQKEWEQAFTEFKVASAAYSIVGSVRSDPGSETNVDPEAETARSPAQNCRNTVESHTLN